MPFPAFSRRRRPTEGGADGLAAHDIAVVYETLLGRRPTAQEIAHQQDKAKGLRELLVAVAASDERQLREAEAAGAGGGSGRRARGGRGRARRRAGRGGGGGGGRRGRPTARRCPCSSRPTSSTPTPRS